MKITHSNICSLGGNDIFFDGWNKSYVVQFAMWNNSKTRFFKITIGRVRLEYEMVASILEAQSVRHYIHLSMMTMDFQLIIFDLF
jgi:hypothetical protein